MIEADGLRIFGLLEWLKRYLLGVNCQKFYRHKHVDLRKGVKEIKNYAKQTSRVVIEKSIAKFDIFIV